MPRQITASALVSHLADRGDEVALLDVREAAEYNLAHIAGACSLPRRQIEFRVEGLVPWHGTPVLVCDDDGVRARPAAETLESLGYSNVSFLTGGLNRRVTEGHGTEWGINVPSKDFGEKVLLHQEVPELEPDQLSAWLQEGKTPILLDSRTPEEHRRACIPGSRSMPGAELGLRIWDLAADPETPVVVHCAGRTRSIVGAATLKRLGLQNVYALKNGTMGWQLAGLGLETGSERLDLPEPSLEGRKRGEAAARAAAEAEGVRFVEPGQAQEILASAGRQNVYAFDVRSRQEYATGHIEGFAWVPGGQAVQATDNYVTVHSGTLLFACDGIARAAMTAAWFRQMGFPDVNILDGGTAAWQAAGGQLAAGPAAEEPSGIEAARGRTTWVTATELSQRQADDLTILHVGTSDEFSRAHIPGSYWLSRSWLEPRVAELAPSSSQSLAITCADAQNSAYAATTLGELGYRDVVALQGGLAAWAEAGLVVETGLAGVANAPNDVLPVSRSYAEMLNYLRWEEQLGEKYEKRG